MRRVVLAMSGGVDSSVAAHLLVEQGHEVIGVFMRTGAHAPEPTCDLPATPQRKTRGCCSALDAGDAQRVADELNLPFYALNFSDDFRRIQDYFADEYRHGRTPNPCVVCNTWLKFGKLWQYAEAIEADAIATGHYARATREPDGSVALRKGIDPTKDQSYFLAGLQRSILDRVHFPVGALQKSEVREIAGRLGWGLAQKPDSQEICFVPDGDYQGFIRRHRGADVEEPGAIVDHAGNKLGEHAGVSRFTIGQRKGLGVAVGEPRYVLRIEPETRLVVIGPQELLERESLIAERVNWLTPQPSTAPFRCEVKIRYLHQQTPAEVTVDEAGRAVVRFDRPQSAVTPGQAVAFYDGDRVLGGGWIANESIR